MKSFEAPSTSTRPCTVEGRCLDSSESTLSLQTLQSSRTWTNLKCHWPRANGCLSSFDFASYGLAVFVPCQRFEMPKVCFIHPKRGTPISNENLLPFLGLDVILSGGCANLACGLTASFRACEWSLPCKRDTNLARNLVPDLP